MSVAPERIEITPASPVVELGNPLQLNVAVYPEGASYGKIAWSFPDCCSVDANGLVTGIKIGSGTITAKISSSVKASCPVSVVNADGARLASKVAITPSKLTLKVGETADLKATVYNASYSGVVWSVSQGAVSVVESTGLRTAKVTGVKVGSNRLIAKSADGNAADWISVSVTEGDSPIETEKVSVPDKVIFVNPRNIKVQKGQYFLLEARGLSRPTGRLSKDKQIFYVKYNGRWVFEPQSSNIRLVKTFSNDNHETYAWFQAGDFPGTYQINIHNSEYEGYGTASCTVQVVDENVQGDAQQISRAYIEDIQFNSDDNPTIDSCVNNPFKVILYKFREYNDGDGIRLKAGDVGWDIPSNNVASISASGDNIVVTRGSSFGIVGARFYLKSNPYIYYPVFIAYGGGEYDDYALSSSVYSSIVNVSGVSLSKTSLTLKVGDKSQLSAVVSPDDATYKSVTWSSSQNSVATVNSDGLVKAVATGTAKITVTTASGGYQASCIVKVLASDATPTPDGGREGQEEWQEYDGGSYANSAVFFDGLDENEEINDITSVGNTLIVSTDKDMYYFLWKEGAYKFLGNQIPIPNIYFRMGNLEKPREAPWIVDDGYNDPDNYSSKDSFKIAGESTPSFGFNHSAVNDVTEFGTRATKYVFSQANDDGFWNNYLDSVWSAIDSAILDEIEDGKAIFPIFVRYAVRLYDGTSYAQSIPILIGADISKYISVVSHVLHHECKELRAMDYIDITSYVQLASSYSIFLKAFGQSSFEGWDDIVTSVDIFISPQILPIQRNAASFKVTFLEEWDQSDDRHPGIYPYLRRYKIDDIAIDPYYTDEHQEEMILNHQATYLAKSYTLEEFRSLNGDVVLDDINFSSDYIMSKEALKETAQSMHKTKGARLFNYNNRLLMSDVEQKFYHGHPFLHSVKWVEDGYGQTTKFPFRFVYHLRGEGDENIIICRDENGYAQITPKTREIMDNGSGFFNEYPYAWLAYPDSRCFKIDVYSIVPGSIPVASYQTKVMDQTDVAYVFVGFGKPVAADTITANKFVGTLPNDENLVSKMPNTLVVSKANNPFVFPAEDMVSLTVGKIMNLAVATKPLSEGQFGQFPLYVFTDDGVFALSTDANGRFQTSHPVSRDNILNKDSLVGIEQGVFFAADRGLLLLQGSTVTKVSSLMDGSPVSLDNELSSIVSSKFFGGSELERPQQFYKFLEGCRLTYDYANTRIILMNERYKTMYVYKFDTQSWHRLWVGSGYPVRALNSYPEAVIVMENGNAQSALDFSVVAESDSAKALPGIIYTRDLAIDSADIYKAISRMKVRGRFKDGHVKWQLQGSNDGVNYTTIHSLRGPSWKWYRILLVTNLGPDERISYIELDYDPKFTNKVR